MEKKKKKKITYMGVFKFFLKIPEIGRVQFKKSHGRFLESSSARDTLNLQQHMKQFSQKEIQK